MRMRERIFAGTLFAIIGACMALPSSAQAALVTYLAAATSQTATADYSFVDGDTLQIILTETTPLANPVAGAAAVLTSVGFDLPGTAELVAAGSTVVINVGSVSVGFDLGDLGAGADVSREYGVTQGQFDPGDGGSWDFVSANTAHVTQLAGANRDSTDALDGPQGGLLDDSAAAPGTGVIDRSVIMTINLDTVLTALEQSAFLTDVGKNSFVEYGSDAAFGRPTPGGSQDPPRVPEPASLAIWMLGISSLGVVAYRRRKALAAK